MPSAEDLATTAHFMMSAKILAPPILDHVIFHSMFQRGTLPCVDE
jgi:hypothetical protein